MRKLALLAILTLFATVAAAQPTITVNTNPSAYTEDAPPVVIDPAFGFSDATPPTSYDTATLTVSVTTNGSAADRLSVGNIAPISASLNVGLDTWFISHGINQIGSYPNTGAGSGNGVALQITFFTPADDSHMQDVLRALRYRTVSNNPPSSVTVTFDLTLGVDSSTDTTDINITPINDAPTLTSVNTLGPVNEDTQIIIDYAQLAAAADEADVDSGTINFRVEALSSGTLTFNGGAVTFGTTIVAAGDQLEWTPAPNVNGATVNAFTIVAHDGALPSAAPVQVNVQVTAVNDAPSVTGGGIVSLNEDAGPQAVANFVGINPGPANESGQLALAYTIQNLTLLGGLTFASGPAIDASGQLTFETTADSNGSATFQVQVQDDGGGVAPNVDTSALSAVFTITVNAINDAPSVNGGSDPIVNEDAGLQTLPGFVGIIPGPADESGQTAVAYTVENLTLLGGLTFTTAPAISSAGTLTFEAAANSNGTATFQVRVQDNGGGVAPNVDTSALSSVFTITVNAVNDAPVVAGVPASLPYTENDPATLVAPAATVTDIDSADFDTGTFIASFISGGTADDQLTIRNSGPITTAPGAPGFIDVLDGATVFGFFADAGAGSGINGQSLQVILNADATPARVQALLNRIEYENISDAPTAIHNIQITVADGDGGLDFASICQVQVTAVNDAPTLAAGTLAAATDEDTAIDIDFSALDLTTGASDLDGFVVGFRVTAVSSGTLLIDIDTLGSFVAVTLPQTVDSNDTLRWTPASNANGLALAAFSVECFDDGTPAPSQTSASPVLISVDVNAVNDAPVFAAGPYTLTNVDEDDVTNTGDAIDASGDITDPDGPGTGIAVVGADNTNGDWQYSIDNGANWLSFGAVTPTSAVLLASDAANTRVRFIPDADWNGSASLEVRGWDQSSGSNGDTGVDTTTGTAFSTNTENIDITVDPVNDAPSVTGSSNPTVNEDAGSQTILNFVGINPGPANESGQIALAYTVQNLTLLGGLTFTSAPAISAAGTLTFETAADSNGSATFQVTVQDNGGTANGGTDTSGLSGVFTITVTAVNDAPGVTGGSNPTVNEDAGPQSIANFVGINPGPADESGQVALAYTVQNLTLLGGLTFCHRPGHRRQRPADL